MNIMKLDVILGSVFFSIIILLSGCQAKRNIVSKIQFLDSTFLETKGSLYVMDSNIYENIIFS